MKSSKKLKDVGLEPSLSTAFIALAGVMGVGKSSLARVLAEKISVTEFIEPEADAWPVPEGEDWEEHVFNLEQWVRETHLDYFKDARQLAEQGRGSVADGGLFLLAKEFMDDPACQFYYGLMNESELKQVRQFAESDWNEAPCPDVLVLLETDFETWRRFLLSRGRSMDTNKNFIDHYAGQQQVIKIAANKYAEEKGIKLVTFTNTFSNITINASRLHDEIILAVNGG